MMCIMWEIKVKFLTTEALRGVNSTIFDVQGSRIDNELGKRNYVTGAALEQGCDLGQGSRCATTEAQQSWVIDEIIDITVSKQRQNTSKSKTLSANNEDPTVKGFRRSWRFTRLEDSEDHGDSPGWRTTKIHQLQYTVKMVDDTAESPEDSAGAAGPVH